MENKPKLTPEFITSANAMDITQVFGEWINNTGQMNTKFANAKPFPYIIIDNFLYDNLAEEISDKFPTDIGNSENWHRYHNPIEVKYANDNIDAYPNPIKDLFKAYASNAFITIMKQLTGIADLEYDEFMHGAGLHIHPRGGRLGLHLDYEKHPISGKQRRINIILYMNKDWNPEWNGHTELWDKDVKTMEVKSPIKFNTAIIFRTNDISWHGLPEPITCPPDVYRKSIAYYYVSEFGENNNNNKNNQSASNEKFGANESGQRIKAAFIARPTDNPHPGMAVLYGIRPHRRITDEDVATHYPEWFSEFDKLVN